MDQNTRFNPSQTFKKYPLIFIGLSLLIFITIILVIVAISVNNQAQSPQTTAELTGSEQADESAKSYATAHPIIKHLPIIYAHYDANYNYTEYRIDGGQFDGCKTDFCLQVTDVTGNNLAAAKQQIKDLGFNPDDYQILYRYTPITPLD